MKKHYEQPILEKELFQVKEVLVVSGGQDDGLIGDNNDGTITDVYDLL